MIVRILETLLILVYAFWILVLPGSGITEEAQYGGNPFNEVEKAEIIKNLDDGVVFVDGIENTKNIIIRNNPKYSHKAYLVNSKKDIFSFKSDFKTVSKFTWDFFDSEYDIIAFDDFVINSMPLPEKFTIYNDAQIELVESWMTPNNLKYLYTFETPAQKDYGELKKQIEEENSRCKVFFPYGSINSIRPSIAVEYGGRENNPQDGKLALKDHKLGEYPHDNILLPLVESMKSSGNYYDISKCYFKGNLASGGFLRGATIYLDRSLSKGDIEKLNEDFGQSFNAELTKTDMGIPFIYKDVTQYKIYILFNEEPTLDILKRFEKYGLVSCDYGKDPINVEKITVYKKYNSDKSYESFTITPDLKVVIKKYHEVDFTPFVDPDPPSKTIDEIDIIEDDFLEIVESLSNNCFMNLPEDVGLSGFQVNSYSYISVTADGLSHISGGDAPEHKNDRFSATWKVLEKVILSRNEESIAGV